MPYDFATDPVTGDWLFSGNRDIQGVEGSQVIAMRIRNRLRVERGSWPLDPSDGALGSRLRELLRLPRGRALNEAHLLVEEALAPMNDDITLVSVGVTEVGVRSITLTIQYTIIQSDDFVPDSDRLNESLTVEIPA